LIYPNITSAAGFNLLTDLADNLGINRALEKLSIGERRLGQVFCRAGAQLLSLAYSLGFQRIEHMEILKDDPTFTGKVPISFLADKSNLYAFLNVLTAKNKMMN